MLKKLAPFLFKSKTQPKSKKTINTRKADIPAPSLPEIDLTQTAQQTSFLNSLANEQASSLEKTLAQLINQPEQLAVLTQLASNHQPLSLAIIQHAPTSELALTCIQQLEADEATWLDITLTNRLAKLRQLAAEKLTSQAALEEVVAKVTNDKGLQRYARQQLQAIKAQQEAVAEQEATIADILQQLTALIKATDRQLFTAKLQHLTLRWEEVASAANSADAANYAALIEQGQVIADELAAEEAERLAAEKERQEQEKQAALAEEKRQAKLAKKLAKKAEKQAAKKAAKKLAAANDAIDAKEEANQQEQQAKQLSASINQLDKLLAEGEVQAATRLNARLNQDFNSPAAAELSHKQEQKYKQLNAQLQELNSWQGFAAAPKRQELLEQMQALAADTSMLAQIKAEKIQSLQAQWRDLGSAAANKELWQAFKSAADEAFEPCKAWFAEQREIKNYNQQQRQTICAELERLTAEKSHLELNEDALDKLLQEVHNEWHRFNPVGRTAGRKLAQEFQQAIKPLKDQLYALRQVNIDAKRELIAQAEALLAEAEKSNQQDALNKAIEANKQLQEEWRTLGRAPGSLEPRLWKEFRTACDALFNKRAAQNLAKLEASTEKYELALKELQTAEDKLAAKQLADAEKHLAASYTQGLMQKHLRQLTQQQQEIKTALSAAKQKAARQALADELQAELAAFAANDEQPEGALEALVNLEILAEQPSAAENQQLRLELQIAQMNLGKVSLAGKQQQEEVLKQVRDLNQLGLGQQTQIYQQLQTLIKGYLA